MNITKNMALNNGGKKMNSSNSNEKNYKLMSITGAMGIAVGIVILVTGIAAGVINIVNGARLLKNKSDLLF